MVRRPTVWVDTILNDTIDTGIFKDDLTAALPATEQQTVTRIVGDIHIGPSSITANITFEQVIDIGIGVASQPAFDAASGVGLPDPRVVAESPARDWLWVTRVLVHKERPAGTTLQLHLVDIHLDLRAARKIDKGVLFLIAVKTVVSGAASDLLLQGRLRALVQT